MRNPIRFKDNTDRLLSEKEKNTAMSDTERNLSRIMEIHQRVLENRDLHFEDIAIVDAVLQNVICGIFHDRAEAVYFGLEVKE